MPFLNFNLKAKRGNSMDLSKANIKKILGIITFTIILYTIMANLSVVGTGFSFVFSLFTPLIVGLGIAFILNVIMRLVEGFLRDKTENIETNHPRN